MTLIGQYTTLKGNTFEVHCKGPDAFSVHVGGKPVAVLREVRTTEARYYTGAHDVARALGASHVVCTDGPSFALDATAATQLTADMAAANAAARATAQAAAWAHPGARLAVSVHHGETPAIGVAWPADGLANGFFWFHTLDTLDGLCSTDAQPQGEAFGKSSQGDQLFDLTEEMAERLRCLANEKKRAENEVFQAEIAREKAIAQIIAEIPAAVVADRNALRRRYNLVENEGGDGYDPYETWLSPRSLDLLERAAPLLAAKLQALA